MAFWNKEKPSAHTNAPKHWPAVQLDQFENPGVNLLLIGGQLTQLFAPPRSTIAFMTDFLYADGILQVPIVVEEDGLKTGVFVYSNHDKDAAAQYSGARALLRSRENAAAVYYGPEPLAPTTPAVVLQPIDTSMFSKCETEPQEANFALWWATSEDPLFSRSEDRALLDRWFEAVDGYGYLLFTGFVTDLDLVEQEEKDKAYSLPSPPFLQPLSGPGSSDLLLHASAPDGLFLAFDQKTTSARTRRLLLKLLSDYAVRYRAAFENTKIPVRSEERGLQTWGRIRDEALAREAHGAAGLILHAVSFLDGQPRRMPSAHTREEEAAAPKMPGREELDFGMDLVDRVVARVQQGAVVGSSQQELGQPNVFPIIAVRAGGHTWERELPYEDGEQAQAAAGRALDDWPDAEIVAVLLDAAIREDDVRTDILSLKIENRATGAATDLFQRYTTSAAGDMELVGNPTATPTDGFLRSPTSGPEGAVDLGLTALAEQALDEIVKALKFGEPSGMLGDDPDDPLVSPSALLSQGEARPKIIRFMLQGPVTAAMSCMESIKNKDARWVVFFIDDLVTKDNAPDRRLRLCVQRREDKAAAIFDQRYETPVKGTPFALRGGLDFQRWAGSFF